MNLDTSRSHVIKPIFAMWPLLSFSAPFVWNNEERAEHVQSACEKVKGPDSNEIPSSKPFKYRFLCALRLAISPRWPHGTYLDDYMIQYEDLANSIRKALCSKAMSNSSDSWKEMLMSSPPRKEVRIDVEGDLRSGRRIVLDVESYPEERIHIEDLPSDIPTRRWSIKMAYRVIAFDPSLHSSRHQRYI